MIIGAAAAAAIGRGAPAPITAFYDTLALNGTNQAVRSIGSTSLGSDSSDFSYSAWAYFTANQADWSGIVLTETGGGATEPFAGLRVGTDGTVWALVYNGATNDYVTCSPSQNAWHHFAMTYTGSTKTIELFLDGVSQGTNTTTATFTQMTNTTIGQTYYSRGADNYLAGSLTDVFTLNKVLTSGDIAELQTPKQPEDYTTSIKNNYVCALPLNDGVIDPENDRSANNNDGTLIGSPTYTGQQLEFTL